MYSNEFYSASINISKRWSIDWVFG